MCEMLRPAVTVIHLLLLLLPSTSSVRVIDASGGAKEAGIKSIRSNVVEVKSFNGGVEERFD